MIDERRCDVLHVVWPGDRNGVMTHLAALVRGAMRDGETSHRVCFLDGTGSMGDELEGEGLAYRLYFRRGWGPIGLWKFARSLRAGRPHLVHFHWRALGSICIAATVLPRTPFVWTEHHPGAVKVDRKTRLFYRLLGRRFARIIVTSRAMAGYVKRLGVDADKIELICHPLALLRRLPEQSGTSRGGVIGVISRIDADKRVDLFIDVITELRGRGVDCSGIVVGDGEPRSELERYAAQRGLDGTVEFVGVQAEIAGWLDRFDIFLTTSAIDTFGIASLEAMARGVPVVAMASDGGLSELVERGGILLRDRDPKSAADAIEALLGSPEERLQTGGRGYRVAAEHTVEASVAGHLKMYRELGVGALPR